MAKDKSRQNHPGDLRSRAEDALNEEKTGKPARTMPEQDVRALVHELQVHQIELEMQNEELKRANAEVEETRNRYVDLYEFAPVGYLTLDENGLIFEANLTAARQLGIERSGLIKRPFQGYIVPADRDKFCSHLNAVVASEKRQSCEIGLATKSGGDFYALLDTVFILDSSGKKFCRTTATDITERKLIEDTQAFLALSGRTVSGEDFFKSLARYLGRSLGMDFVCIDRLDGDLLCARTLAVYFDGKFEDNVTYTLKDTPCGEVVEKKVCCFPKDVRRLFPGDEVLQEIEAESYVGAILWGSKGLPIGLIAVIGRQPLANCHLVESVLQLVALRAAGELERRLVEEELRENRSRLDLALQSAHMGVWRLNLIENKRHFDDQVCHLLGIAPAEFTGTEEEFYKAVHHDDREMLKAVWARTIEHDVPYEAEYRALWPDGSVHYVTARGKLVHNDKGRPVMVNGLIWDITDRKQMEEALRKSRDEMQLRVQERTKDLALANENLREVPSRLIAVQENERRRLAGDMHDSIGQTLAALKFRIEHVITTMEKREHDQATRLLHEFVPILQHSIDETRAIYMGLKPQILSDHGVLATLRWYCLELLKIYPNQHIELETSIREEDIPEDLKIAIFRIVQEALNNVAKHARSEWVDVRLAENGGAIELEIRDDGIGMSLDLIMESRSAKSLGLIGMRERTEITGGEFTLESAPDEGTSVKAVWRNHLIAPSRTL
jgi:PAS domain S-box-containing protein